MEKVMDWCTSQWKMLLFCAKIIVKESHKLELARLKKEEEEEEEEEEGEEEVEEEEKNWLPGDFLVRYFHDAF